MSQKVVIIEPIGPVVFKKNPRSKRIRLKVGANLSIAVSLPLLAEYRDAISFVESKTDWILAQQQKMTDRHTTFSPETVFRTRFHQLKIVTVPGQKVFSRIGGGIIQVFIPLQKNHAHPDIQAFIRQILIKVMRFEARNYLPLRVSELASVHKLKVQGVAVKNIKTRWGSCSSTNNINLNIHLMRLPDHLIDYVILHELAHTVEKNHSTRFWTFLEQLLPGAKKLDKEMNQYHTGIF